MNWNVINVKFSKLCCLNCCMIVGIITWTIFLVGFAKESSYETSATLFSLSHPLDDICPVAVHQAGITNIFNSNHYKIVFTSDQPSICMIYDFTTKQHSVFRIRKTRPNEGDFGEKLLSGIYSINQSNKVDTLFSLFILVGFLR